VSLEAEVESPIARIKYPDVKTFKELIVALSKILDEAKLLLTRTGLRIVGMDPAKVAYIEVHMPREAFLEYEIEEDREVVEAGFNLGVLEDILEGRKGNPVEMVIAQDKVLVSVEGAVIRRFLLPNLEVAVEELGEVELEHDVKAVVISDVLKKAISDIKAVSDIVEIEADENQIVLRSTGEAGPKVTLRLTRESSALIDLEARNPSRAKYDVSYLENTLNLCKVAESVELMFSTDKPLELNFKSPDGSTVRYILAPSAT
jgi:proliferating cell nuclear antigen